MHDVAHWETDYSAYIEHLINTTPPWDSCKAGASISPFQRFANLRHLTKQPTPFGVHLQLPDALAQQPDTNKDAYLKALATELSLIGDYLHQAPPVQLLRLRGPAHCLKAEQIQALMAQVHRYFPLNSNNFAYYAIELNPLQANWSTMGALRDIGFNRVNLHSPNTQGSAPTVALQSMYEAARALQFNTVSIQFTLDCSQAAPQQDLARLKHILSLQPDRILLSLANPTQDLNPERLRRCFDNLKQAGYMQLSSHCFSLTDDEWAEPGLPQKHLFSLLNSFHVLGFGAQAVSHLPGLSTRNCTDLNAYIHALQSGQLSPAMGYPFHRDESIRRTLLAMLSSQGCMPLPAFKHHFNLEFNDYFASVLPQLKRLQALGYLELSADQLRLTPLSPLTLECVNQVICTQQQP